MSIWSPITKSDRENEAVLLELARKATYEDWGALQTALQRLALWERTGFWAFAGLLASMTAFLSTILMDNYLTAVAAFMTFSTMGAMFLSIAMSAKYEFAEEIYPALVKLELKRKTELLPLWLTPEPGLGRVWPYRARPVLTPEQCDAMRQALGRFRLFPLFFAGPIIAAVAYFEITAKAYDHLALSVVPEMALVSAAFAYLFHSIQQNQLIDAVTDYEDLTGEMVLPDDIRQANYILRVRLWEAREKAETERMMATSDHTADKVRCWKQEQSRQY
jgi:hypothetical protein